MRYALVLLLALAAATAQAQQMYRWLDKNGKVQYGETPPPGVAAKAVVNRTGVAVGQASQAPAASAQPSARTNSRQVPGYGKLAPAEQDEYEAAAERQRRAERAKR
jgi:hypothetical protein